MLTPAQTTSLLILAGLAGLALLLFFLFRALRSYKGRREIVSGRATGGAGAQGVGVESEVAWLPGPWQALRDEVEAANRALSRPVFDCARRLFLDYYTAGGPTPAALTREYDREEFLLVVDEHGRPSRPAPGVLESYHKTASARPAFARWFQEGYLQEGEFAGTPVLLAARWLCHLVGLRHSTVEIFIDPPAMPGHTLVQVRGMDKFEAPGAFDIPCAGHISGVDTVEEALRKELSEELNLSLDDLDELRLVGRYNSFGEEGANGMINHEHRVLYQARLKPEAAGRIRFSDGEVAGLSVFSVAELRELVRRYPERVAGGLADAIGMYEE